MSMTALLGKLLNVRPAEWQRLSLLYLMSLIALTGMNWGDAIVQAAFLQQLGVQYLPWVFISSAACSLGALFIYSAFADRVSNTRLLIAILAISCAGLLLGLAMLAGGLVKPAYLLLYLVLNVPLLDLYNVHWATYANSFYDIQAAKRIVPVLGSAARVAGILGGLSVPLLNRLLSPAAIVVACVITLAGMAVLAAAMPLLLHEQRTLRARWPGWQAIADAGLRPTRPGRANETAPTGASAGALTTLGRAGPARRMPGRLRGFARAYSANLREGYQQIARSSFLRWMALSTLTMTILLALLNYRASAIFQAELKTTVQISNFLGVLSGVANLLVLPIQLFLLSRLIARLGLGDSSLVYPLASLASAGSLVIAPGLPTATLAYLDRTALRTAFRLPTDNLLYNAVPQHVKARTRAFVGGLLVPAGNLVGGLLLLTPLMRTSHFLPAAILILALALALAGLLVRQHYAQALVSMLEQEDYSSLALQAPSLQAPAPLPLADADTLGRLTRKLHASTSPEQAIFMARLIGEIGGEAAVPILGQAARSATDSWLRASLVDVLVAADLRGDAARDLYVDMLTDGDWHVRLSAVAGLEQIEGPGSRRYLEIATRLLVDPKLAVRLRVLPTLLRAGDPACRAAASAELRALLNAHDPNARALALHAVGQARAAGFLPDLVRSLSDGTDEVRLAAALAAEMLVTGGEAVGSQALLIPMMGLLSDPIDRARLAAVNILGRLSQGSGDEAQAAFEGLAMGLADPSFDVREQAVNALAHAGQRAIPQLFEQLGAASPHLRKMAAVGLARIEPRKYAPLLLGPNLHANLLAIYRTLAYLQALAACPGPAVTVLGCALRERNAALLDEIFYLLAAVHDLGAVETIANALGSPQPTQRANAAEALESLTSPQTAALLAPLFEPDLPPERLAPLLKQAGGTSIPSAATALRLLLSDSGDAWLRTLAAAVLAELSAAGGPLSQAEIALLLGLARADLDPGVRAEIGAEAAVAAAAGVATAWMAALSLVKKLMLVKAVPFFHGMKIDQLRVLAAACEEQSVSEGAHIFDEGDAGDALYLVVNGRVAIEQQIRTGSRVRLATVEPHGYFGESAMFDNCPRSTAAVALQDTLTLRLRRELLFELAGRYPDISLRLIDILARQLRAANDQLAGLARGRPRKLHRLFDSLEEDVQPAR
jgi:CRP-like cAMP-binding protein/HEAT repeat protein